MSNFEKFNYNNEDFYTRDTTTYLVKGTQASSTNVWTGNLPDGITGYKEGLTIDYFLPCDGTASNATLNLSNQGAIAVKAGDSNDPVTNQFPQNSVIRLTYVTISGTPVWKVGAYYSGGSVSSIGVGAGLTTSNSGNPITSSGTISLCLDDDQPDSATHKVVIDQEGKLAVNVQDFVASSSEGAGSSGLVPMPSAGNMRFLGSNNSRWQTVNITDSNSNNISTMSHGSSSITNFKLADATTSLSGLMSSADKTKLDGVTDEKVKVENVTSGTTYYPIVGTGTTASTRQYDSVNFSYKSDNLGYSVLSMGNKSSVSGGKIGVIDLYGLNSKGRLYYPGTGTTDYQYTFPNGSGTLALTTDIPTRGTPTSGGTTLSVVNTGDMYNWNSKTSNTGTVTSVTLTGNNGITVSNSGTSITTSGSRTIGHSNSVTAQTTQAVYPIKIDAQGHISAYGSAIADYVIESGMKTYSDSTRERNWYYRKWNSGKVEAWLRAEIVFPSVTSATNGFYMSSKEVAIPNGIFTVDNKSPKVVATVASDYDAIISVLAWGTTPSETDYSDYKYVVKCKQVRPTQSSSGSGRYLNLYCWVD